MLWRCISKSRWLLPRISATSCLHALPKAATFSSFSRAPPLPSAQWPTQSEMPTNGLDSAIFKTLWESALDAHARGRYAEALAKAKASIETAAEGEHGSLGREHALRMAHHLTGVAYMQLGCVAQAVQSLEQAKDIAIRVSGAGGGDDAYTDLGGVLNDLGVAKALAGDKKAAQKNVSRTLYMARRAYRPDEDLVSAACSNLAEVMWMMDGEGGGEGEGIAQEAVELAEKAARLTDKMERLSLLRQSSAKEEAEPVGGEDTEATPGRKGGSYLPPMPASDASIQAKSASTGVWALPVELLAFHERSTRRRLILGRCLARAHREEEAAYYLFQALQDSRRSGLRCNPILYAQCLAAVGNMHLLSLLRRGLGTDLSHLAAAGCREDNEMTWDAQGLLVRALGVLEPVLGKEHPEVVACHANLALFQPLARAEAVLADAMRAAGGEREDREGGGGPGGEMESNSSKKVDGHREHEAVRSEEEGSGAAQSPLSSPPVAREMMRVLEGNRQALNTLIIAVGRHKADRHCAVELVAAKQRRRAKGRQTADISLASTEIPVGTDVGQGEGGCDGFGRGTTDGGIEEEEEEEPPPPLQVLWTLQGVVGVGLQAWDVKAGGRGEKLGRILEEDPVEP
ncbi:Tetratricopeptide-like helical [Nannochloropsis gaditana]|uniref:Tetratricopeptide-like helical n=1 Tax=Nannochloropsis gaditana TaxID=72520 RepID=W7TIL4_9STRA|nr:Tetratricopeptide-like helical [Nannochloropsis gaditana]